MNPESSNNLENPDLPQEWLEDILNSTDKTDIALLDKISELSFEDKQDYPKDFVNALNNSPDKNLLLKSITFLSEDFSNLSIENWLDKSILDEIVSLYEKIKSKEITEAKAESSEVKNNSIRKKEKVLEVKEENYIEKNKLELNIKKYNDIFDEKLLSSLNSTTVNKISDLKLILNDWKIDFNSINNKNEKLKDLLNYFNWEWNEEFQIILAEIAKNNPEQLNDLSNLIKSVNPNFKLLFQINTFQDNLNSEDLWRDRIIDWIIGWNKNVFSWEILDKDWNKTTFDIWDNASAIVDDSTIPPKTYTSNGSYNLELKPFYWPLLKPTLEYEKELTWLTESKKELNSEWLKLQNTWKEIFNDLQDIKKQLSDISESESSENEVLKELLEERLSDFEKLLEENKNQILQKIEEIKKVDWKILDLKISFISETKDLQEEYNNKLKEKVERQKEILKFIKNSWLWIIPQDIINKLLNDFKSWVISINELSLNRKTLDIENWTFWESTTETWKWIDWFWNQAKQNIVSFMNKMIYGDVNYEKSILPRENWVTKDFTINPTSMIWELKNWNPPIFDWTNWNINAMRHNLWKINTN